LVCLPFPSLSIPSDIFKFFPMNARFPIFPCMHLLDLE
jgi:hypothetical protein